MVNPEKPAFILSPLEVAKNVLNIFKSKPTLDRRFVTVRDLTPEQYLNGFLDYYSPQNVIERARKEIPLMIDKKLDIYIDVLKRNLDRRDPTVVTLLKMAQTEARSREGYPYPID